MKFPDKAFRGLVASYQAERDATETEASKSERSVIAEARRRSIEEAFHRYARIAEEQGLDPASRSDLQRVAVADLKLAHGTTPTGIREVEDRWHAIDRLRVEAAQQQDGDR